MAYGIAAAVAALGTVVMTVVVVTRDSDDGTAVAGSTAVPNGQSGFILFDEVHTTLFVTPGAAGENTVEVVVARHDGTTPTDVSEVTVTVARHGSQVANVAAQPLPGSPGSFRASGVSIPSAGDWEFGISLRADGSEPVSDTTVIPIGEPSNS